MQGLFLNLLPVSFQLPVSSFGLQEGDKETSQTPSHYRRGCKKEIQPPTHPEVDLQQSRARIHTASKVALIGRGKGSLHLEHLDETASRMQVLRWKLFVTELESVDLKAEGDTFLTTLFPRRELSADAVNLRWRSKEKARWLQVPPTCKRFHLKPVTCQSRQPLVQQLAIPNQCLFLKCKFVRFFPMFKPFRGYGCGMRSKVPDPDVRVKSSFCVWLFSPTHQ